MLLRYGQFFSGNAVMNFEFRTIFWYLVPEVLKVYVLNTAQRFREKPLFLKSVLCVWQFHVKYWKGGKLFRVFVFINLSKSYCYCSKA